MTSLLFGHMTNMRLPVIWDPKPKPTHPKLPGAWTVARISESLAEEDEVTGMEKATQTPELESHACVLLAALTRVKPIVISKASAREYIKPTRKQLEI